MSEERKFLSYGDRAVGTAFNPSNNIDVENIKQTYAFLINVLNDFRDATNDGEKKRLYSVAITEAQTAQMWAVKAVTWSEK